VGRAADERWHIRHDGSRFYGSGVLTALRDAAGELRGFVKILRDLTEHLHLQEELQQTRDELDERVQVRTAELAIVNESLKIEVLQRREAEQARSDVVRRLSAAEEDERKRISRELHDQLGQQLTALLLGLNALKQQRGEEALQRIDELVSLVETLGREMHQLTLDLRPTALDDLGLAAALSSLAEEWSRRTGLQIPLLITGLEGARFSPEVETTLYRVVQEALTNVSRHAQATQVSIILERHDDAVVVIVEDDGVGFEAEALTARRVGHLGLLGMQERVALVGGTLTIESSAGNGTTVFARVPLSEE
jgi:signal transduction histidine kinase